MDFEQIQNSLEGIGYDCKATADSVLTTVAVDDKEYPVNFGLDENNGEVVINCAFGEIADFVKTEDDIAAAGWWLLSQNSQIPPFALSVLDTEDGIDGDDPIVLIDSRNFEVFDASDVMDDLQRALVHLHDHVG